MTPERLTQSRAILESIATAAGLTTVGASPIRLAENDLWLLPDKGVVRIARQGQDRAAAREVAVARWLEQVGIPAVRLLPIPQPVHAAGRAATFWKELPPHHAGSTADLAPLLQKLHRLPIPDFDLGALDPFVRLADRIHATHHATKDDRAFLLDRLRKLQAEWDSLPPGLPTCVIHGDAWGGNCAVTATSTVLLDFERTSIGPPEWDLTSTAVARDTFGTLSHSDYEHFATGYGYDVRSWDGYSTLRSIRELRLATFALQIADSDPSARSEARHRISCLRDPHSARPWNWTPVG